MQIRPATVHPSPAAGAAGQVPLTTPPLPPDVAPPELVAGGEQTALVEECLEQLSDEYRELIILRDYIGSSWDEIARETGRPSPDAARMKHATAVLELAKLVRKVGGV